MRQIFRWIGLISLVGCTIEEPLSSTSDNGVTQNLNELYPELQVLEPYIEDVNHLSDYIYSQEKVHRFDLYITDENLEILDNDPAAEKYVSASLVFENQHIENVGIRYKGSIGAWVGCLSGSDWTNPSGFKTCPKLSMKIKLNRQSDRTFYQLKKLQFHSQNLDPTKMHERLGYYLFRDFNVVAPRSNHVVLYINGEFNGLFANTENIDGAFTDHHFENGKGNLYKEVWPINSFGQAQDESYFKDGLKTNEEIADVSKMRAFGEEIEEQEYAAHLWMDKTLFLKHLVVDRRIRHDDGFLHWYQNEGTSYSNHNFYWYEFPNSNIFQLIPWDLDNAFENIWLNRNPVTPIKDKWYEISNNCEGFKYGAFEVFQKSAACDKIISAFVSDRFDFERLDSLFLKNHFNQERIDQLLLEWSEQIEFAIDQAHKKFPDQELASAEWKNEVEKLKNEIFNSITN
jgi:spore coat protein CotH